MEKNRTILGKKLGRVASLAVSHAPGIVLLNFKAIEADSCHANSLKQHSGGLRMHV